jgi:hypothetical protein
MMEQNESQNEKKKRKVLVISHFIIIFGEKNEHVQFATTDEKPRLNIRQ